MAAFSLSISDIIAIPTLVLTALQSAYFAGFHKTKISRLFSLLFLFLTGFLLLTLDDSLEYPKLVFFILGLIAILVPGTLWLLTFNLFSDDKKVDWRFWLLFVAYVCAQSVGTAISLWSDTQIDESVLFYSIVNLFPQTCMMGLAIHAIYFAIQGYYSDLIEARRVVRVVFVVFLSILVIIVLANGVMESVRTLSSSSLAIEQDVNIFPDTLIAAYLMALAVAFHFFAFTLRDDISTLVRSPDSESPVLEEIELRKALTADEKLACKIIDKVKESKIYREEKYTITQFAEFLGTPEHKLRRIINQHLEYRNFNQFLNKFRVEEAAELLVEGDMPISTIAYEVGFATLSVFNRAFKDHFNETPKSFRSKH